MPKERALVVADLHLGYEWVHRASGNLLPIGATEPGAARLDRLVREYEPRLLILLGDVVHRALPLQPLRDEIQSFLAGCSDRLKIQFLLGNHDARIESLLDEKHRSCIRSITHLGSHTFLHGDISDEQMAAELIDEAKSRGGRVIIGHEHPTTSLSDGVTTLKCPAFLISAHLLVLPAFSQWASGCNAGSHKYLSALSRSVKFESAVAIVGNRYVHLPLNKKRRRS